MSREETDEDTAVGRYVERQFGLKPPAKTKGEDDSDLSDDAKEDAKLGRYMTRFWPGQVSEKS